MNTMTKKRKERLEKVDREKFYTAEEALKLVKENATSKFDESIEIAMNLGRRTNDQSI